MSYENANNLIGNSTKKEEIEYFIRRNFDVSEGLGQEESTSDKFLIANEIISSDKYTSLEGSGISISNFDIMAEIPDNVMYESKIIHVGRIFGYSIDKNWLINDLRRYKEGYNESDSFLYCDAESQELCDCWFNLYDMYSNKKANYGILDVEDESNSYIYFALSIELCSELQSAALESLIMECIIPNFYEKRSKNVDVVIRDFYIGEASSRGEYNADSNVVIDDLIKHHNYKKFNKDENKDTSGFIIKKL